MLVTPGSERVNRVSLYFNDDLYDAISSRENIILLFSLIL